MVKKSFVKNTIITLLLISLILPMLSSNSMAITEELAKDGQLIESHSIGPEFFEQEAALKKTSSSKLTRSLMTTNSLKTQTTTAGPTFFEDPNEELNLGLYVIQEVAQDGSDVYFKNVNENGVNLFFTDLYRAQEKMLSLNNQRPDGSYINYVVRNKNNKSAMNIVATNMGYAVTWPAHGYDEATNRKTITRVYDEKLNETTYLVYNTITKYFGTYSLAGVDYVKVAFSGREGYLKLENVDIIPAIFVKNQLPAKYADGRESILSLDTYRVVDKGSYKELQVKGQNTDYFYEIGVADDWMMVGDIYYSTDNNYFYKDIELEQRVNNTPYYNYYQYLPIESKSKITASELNKFVSDRVGDQASAMKGLGQSFIDGQAESDINALLTFSLAVLESATGTSYLALNKNNLFGWQAIDSDPINGAYVFSSPAAAVKEMMTVNIKTYTNTNSWKYNGPFLGNKGAGMNVYYASNPDWSRLIASIAYRVDKASGFKDLNAYQLGTFAIGNDITIYKDSSKASGPIRVQTSPTSSTFTDLVIKGLSKGLKDQHTIVVKNDDALAKGFYEIKLPNSKDAGSRYNLISGFVDSSLIKLTNTGDYYNPADSTQPNQPSIPDTSESVPELLYVKGRSNVRSSMDTSVQNNIVGQKYQGETIMGVLKDNFYQFEEGEETFYIHKDTVSSAQVEGPVYVNRFVNIRDAKSNQIVGQLKYGDYVKGIQIDEYLYFTYNGANVKSYLPFLTYGHTKPVYLKAITNVRDQYLNIVGQKYPGEMVYGIKLGNYYRFIENGKIRFVHASLVSEEAVTTNTFTIGTVNVRDAVTSKVIGSLKIGSLVRGYRSGNYIYFNYNGVNAKVFYSLVSYGIHRKVTTTHTVNVRNQDMKIVDFFQIGQEITAFRVGDYYRFWKDGGIKLIWANFAS